MKWYSFRKRKLDLIIPVPYYYKLFNKKTIGTELLYLVAYEKGWHHDLILQDDFDRAGEFLFDELKKDKDNIKKRLKRSRKTAEKFLMFCRDELSETDKYENDELLSLLEKFYRFYQEFSIENIPPWLFLVDKLHNYILDKLSRKSTDANKIYTILSTPNIMTYTKKEELDVLEIAIKAKGGGKADVKKLVKNYFWIPFDYTGPVIWDEKYYKNRIKELLTFDIDVLKRQRDEIYAYHKNLVIEQKKLIGSLKLSSELIGLFDAVKDIAILQDEKKAVTTEAHYYLQNLFKVFALKTSMDYSDFYFLLNEEIREILLNPKDIKKTADERKKFSISIVKDGNVEILIKNKAMKYAKENNVPLLSDIKEEVYEITGVTGSPGCAVGRARIIHGYKEMSKFKKGEILVTTMTTPDYVIAMKKAVAVVTDEGGITCHAAIVSRESGIPCIIGTKIATQVLKDGDKVKVDADNGIVTII